MVIYLLTPAAMAQSTASYSYDSLGRLWRVDMGGGTAIVYSYDAAGNRIGVVVNAAASSPTVTLTSPAPGSTLQAPATVNLTANAADSDGSVAKVDFYNGSTLLGSDTTAPYSFSWTNVPKGSYSLTAKATDNSGLVTTSSAVAFNVVNPWPSVNLTAPANNSVLTAPATINLTANASDVDGIARVEFYLDHSTLLGSDTTAPYSFTWNGVAAGTYTLTAKALDTTGYGSTSTAVTVKVVTASLSLTEVNRVSPTTSPTAATVTYRVGNSGGAAASSISYTGFAGVTLSAGPTSCAANTANCGSITVTSGTSAGSYAGTLVATPSSGTAGTAAVSLMVNSLPILSLTKVSGGLSSTSPTPAWVTYRLGNSGGTAASSISYSTFPGVAVDPGAPNSCAAKEGSCGFVQVTSGTAAGTYTGTLVATPNSGTAGSAAVSLDVVESAAAVLTVTEVNRTGPTISPLYASVQYQIGNSGNTPISIAYSASIPGVKMSYGPPNYCEANTPNCGTVTLFTETAPGTYTGPFVVTPSAGRAVSRDVNLVVYPRTTSISLTEISSSGPTNSPNAATVTYRVGNSGAVAVSGISYTGFAGVSLGAGPTSCAANTTNCGTITVASGTAVGWYIGTLVATTNEGSAGYASVNLVVEDVRSPPFTPPSLYVYELGRSSPTVSPAVASATYMLVNYGRTAARGITYTAFPGVTISGPTSCAAEDEWCGAITVTSGTAAGTYAGTLVATPSSGTAGSAAVSLVVNAPLVAGASLGTSPIINPNVKAADSGSLKLASGSAASQYAGTRAVTLVTGAAAIAAASPAVLNIPITSGSVVLP